MLWLTPDYTRVQIVASGSQEYETVNVASPLFQQWFAGSKVVRSDGSPQPVFHGNEVGEIQQFRPGTFFTESKNEAKAYAEQTDVYEDVSIRYEPVSKKYKLKEVYDVYETIPDYFDYDGPPNKIVANGNTSRFFYWDGKTNPVGDKNIVILSGVVTGDGGPSKEVASGFAVRPIYGPTVDDEGSEPRQLDRTVHHVYLSIKNPIQVSWQEANLLGKRLGATDEQIEDAIKEYRAQGYDGIETESDDARFFGNRSVRQWLIFDSDQAKTSRVDYLDD